MAVAKHPGVHQAAVVFFVFAAQHRRQRGAVVIERDVGDETQAALVDADQRNAMGRQLPPDTQHRAVAADDQHQVALRADARQIQVGVAGNADTGSRVALDDHLAPLRGEEVRDVLQGGPRRAGRRARHRGVVLADQGNLAELGFHRQIKSLNSPAFSA